MIPATFIFAGIGFEFIWKIFQERKKKISFILITTAILMIIFANGNQYLAWSQKQEVKASFDEKYTQIANYLNSLPQNQKKYVLINAGGTLVNNIPMPSQSIMFITNTYTSIMQQEKNIFYILPENIKQIENPNIIIPLEYNEQIKQNIKDYFPNSQVVNWENFSIFKIN